ncbi:hypothetical protein Hanom_Chr00s000002g01598711 [Helianthus anomalus]
MGKEKRDAEEAAEALKDKRKGVVIDTEEILGSSSQQEQLQPDGEVNVSHVEANIDDLEMKDAEVEVKATEIEVNATENEVNNDLAIVPSLLFTVVGKPKDVVYSKEDEDHQDDKDDKDNKDDKGNDDEDGAGGASNVKSSGTSNVEDFLNDEQNEERDEAQHQGESSFGTKHADLHQVLSNTPKVIYLNHTEEEGEIVENLARESMLESLDMEEDKFKFDNEEEIPPTPDREYGFKFVNEADNFVNVVVEDGSDSDQDYFEFLQDIKTLPWWDVDELVKTKNIKQYYYGSEVKCHEQRLWNYIKQQAKLNFPDWKPHQPKQIVKIDPITREKDTTLHVKRPRCLKNMPLGEMEQDFFKDFKGWIFNPSTCEAMITLLDDKIGDWRHIHVLDPMWLVNCLKKDIECLFFNKIVYNEVDKNQVQRYQKLGNVCFAKDINSGRSWESKWRNLELEELLKKERCIERMEKTRVDAAKRGSWRLGLEKPVIDQTPIEKKERKIPRWSKARDGNRVYREWWINEGRPLRQKMFEERKEEGMLKNEDATGRHDEDYTGRKTAATSKGESVDAYVCSFRLYRVYVYPFVVYVQFNVCFVSNLG